MIDSILKTLREIAKKDKNLAKEIEKEIVLLIKKKSPKLKEGSKLAYEIMEDIKKRKTIDLANTINMKKNTYVTKKRVNRKKALFDMTWILKQNKDLFQKEIYLKIIELEK